MRRRYRQAQLAPRFLARYFIWRMHAALYFGAPPMQETRGYDSFPCRPRPSMCSVFNARPGARGCGTHLDMIPTGSAERRRARGSLLSSLG